MKRLFTGVATALVLTTFATAETPLDSERQSSMFKSIFSYDKHLRESDKIVVLVFSADPSGSAAQGVATVLRESGLFPAVVSPSNLSDSLAATLSPEEAVVYIMEGTDYAPIKAFAAAMGFLTIAGLPSLAEAGHVSVSVDMNGNRPEVVVNMPRLETEGHEFSAELLKLARVIR